MVGLEGRTTWKARFWAKHIRSDNIYYVNLYFLPLFHLDTCNLIVVKVSYIFLEVLILWEVLLRKGEKRSENINTER